MKFTILKKEDVLVWATIGKVIKVRNALKDTPGALGWLLEKNNIEVYTDADKSSEGQQSARELETWLNGQGFDTRVIDKYPHGAGDPAEAAPYFAATAETEEPPPEPDRLEEYRGELLSITADLKEHIRQQAELGLSPESALNMDAGERNFERHIMRRHLNFLTRFKGVYHEQ